MRFDQRRERSTHRYQKMRRAFLRQNPLCAMCKVDGIIRHAEELDHIIPLKLAPDRMWDLNNLQGLCRVHHFEKTSKENSGMTDEREEWLARLETM